MEDRNILQEKMDQYRSQAASLLVKADILEEIIHDIEQTNPKQPSNQTTSVTPTTVKVKFGGKKPKPQSIIIKNAAIKLLDDGVPRLLSVIRRSLEKELHIQKIPESTLRYLLDKEQPRIIKLEGEGYKLVKNEETERTVD